LHFLRSTILTVIVSLFVFAGYARGVCGGCCEHRKQGQSEHDQAPASSNDCQCVCHEPISPAMSVSMPTIEATFVSTGGFVHADEFPPDAVPLGIDHPPQLG
jgi:hypothetical protein